MNYDINDNENIMVLHSAPIEIKIWKLENIQTWENLVFTFITWSKLFY